jgi:glycosyltransferase involved in cell wall biosynthesis
VFSTFAVGGAQVRFAVLANRFGARCRHAVIAMDGDIACRERLAPGLDVTFPAVGIRKGDTIGNVRRFRRVLAALRPDRLVTNNWGSIEWALANALVGRPHVHIEDGFGPDERSRQLPRRVWTRRLALRRSRIVLPSRTLERIALEVWRLPRKRVLYIPNGIDLARFAVPPGPAPWAAGEGPVIGTVAALRAEKNLDRLLGAFARVCRAWPPDGASPLLVIVGDGPERAALQARASEFGIAARVRFTGHLAAPEAAYPHFDICALSSDTEQMPLSVLEAMAAGLPVAATDVGDVAEMLSPENRPFVVPRDEAALAAALTLLLAAPERRRAVGEANRKRVGREYAEATMVRRYAEVLGVRMPSR